MYKVISSALPFYENPFTSVVCFEGKNNFHQPVTLTRKTISYRFYLWRVDSPAFPSLFFVQTNNDLGRGRFGKTNYGYSIENENYYLTTPISELGIKSSLKDLDDGGEGFRNEIEHLPILSHPNIVKFLHGFHFKSNRKDKFLLLLEYLPTSNLIPLKFNFVGSKKILRKDIPLAMYQIGKALKFIHKKNLVHNDVNPANIGRGTDGNYRLYDFGKACSSKDPEEIQDSLGKVAFAPPEMFASNWNDCNDKVDIWAFGATIYTLYSREILGVRFRQSHDQITEKIHEKIDMLRDLMPDEEFDLVSELLKKSLVVSVKNRASIKDLLQLPYFQRDLSQINTKRKKPSE